mmetsp:Transcript_13023/g.45781  ORF Transcript_13023/g.45781 Transcript_13023/m.45781 type:complete len:207 (-) Transcript_13023:784-1404(-)
MGALGHDVVQDAAQRERVDLDAALFPSDLLGCSPSQRAGGSFEARVLVVELLGEAHVADLDPPALSDEQIHGLQVSVDDVHAMQVADAADQLEHGNVRAEERGEGVERGGGELVDEGSKGALAELEGEVEEAAVSFCVKVPHDVGMHVGGYQEIHLLLRHLHEVLDHPLHRNLPPPHPPAVHHRPLAPVAQHLIRLDLHPPHCEDR